MSIEKLEEFAKDGDKNLDNLDVSQGFLQSEKPERQWFNQLLNNLTRKTNEVIDYTDGVIDDVSAQKLDTGITVTAKNGGIKRNQAEKNLDTVSVKDFGAIGDGSGVTVQHWYTIGSIHYKGYASLSAVQVDYPHVTSADCTIDFAGIQKALNSGLSIDIPSGIYVCNDELFQTTHGQSIKGSGKGAGYTSGAFNPVISWTDQCTILFVDPVNPDARYVKTRALSRTSTNAPQDRAMSSGLNIQGESVRLKDFCVRLAISNVPNDPLTDSPTNYGSDWDIGIFVGCRPQVTMTDVAVVGYWRRASIWYDVTRAHFLPDIINHRGEQGTKGTVSSGGDGAQLTNVLTYGGLWGVVIQGRMGINGGWDTDGEEYYDALSGLVIPAYGRGAFGFSDFLAIGCSFYGADHHTLRRFKDISTTPSVASDFDVGGCVSIDGLSGNASGSIQGHRFVGCRFSTYAPFQIRLDHSHRDVFIAGQHENHSNKALSTTGVAVPNNQTGYYGPFAKTSNTSNTKLISSGTVPYPQYWSHGYNDVSVFSDDTGTTVNDGNFYGKSYNTFGSGKLGTESSAISLQSGAMSGASIYLFSNPSDLFAASLRYSHANGHLTYRNPAYSTNTSGTMFDWYASGTTTILETPNVLEILSGGKFAVKSASGGDAFSIFTGSTTAEFAGSIKPSVDNNRTLGLASNRWSQIYAATGSINTSDERLKTSISQLGDAEKRAAMKIKSVIGRYQFTEAVNDKGEEARYHFGVGAQTIGKIMRDEGLNPEKYAFYCYDEWESNIEENIESAGNRYGVRYDELSMFILAAI